MDATRRLWVWLVVATTATGTATFADDLAPPPFRGQPHSVMAKFDLFGGAVPGGPSQYGTVPGVYPLDQLAPFVGQPTTDPTRNALVYPIGLPNFIDPLPLKLIRVQYSWFSGAPSGGPLGDGLTDAILPSPGGSVQLVNSSPATLVPGTGNVYHRWDDFEIVPNPDSERFEIAFIDADPRWIVIDTISLPEPSGFAAAGVVALMAALRRRV